MARKLFYGPVLFAALLGLTLLMASACSSIEEKASVPQTVSAALPTFTKTKQVEAAPTESSTSESGPELKDTETPAPTVTNTSAPPTVAPTNTIQPTATSVQLPTDLAVNDRDISVFPVPAIYEGDLVSIRIDPFIPDHISPNDVDVLILIDDKELTRGNLNARNLNGDAFGLFQWAWDTTDLEGSYSLTAVLDPSDQIAVGDEDVKNNTASLEVTVRPRTELNELEAEAAWISLANECCIVHAVTGTAAHRDLDELLVLIDSAFEQASTKLREPFEGPYDVYLIDRVIGQGGYATDAVVVSYLDRDYAGSGIYEVLVHEAVHLIDRQFAPKRLSFLSEGLAVWASGGHYRQEDINQKMAGIVEGGLYIDIEKVVGQIYSLQHELSYLEAASFLSYLIETYGWNRVRDFYADTDADDGFTLAAAVDSNLKMHFGRSLEEVEADWLAFLGQHPRDRNAVTNLRTTIRFYNVMRRYQQQFDPSAYYLYAWLPSPKEAEEKAATAYLSRHPETSTNIALETILMAANRALDQGDFALARAYLDTVDRIIDSGGQFLDPLSASFLEIVRTAELNGFEVQEIFLSGDNARILAVEEGEEELADLQLELNDNAAWVLIH